MNKTIKYSSSVVAHISQSSSSSGVHVSKADTSFVDIETRYNSSFVSESANSTFASYNSSAVPQYESSFENKKIKRNGTTKRCWEEIAVFTNKEHAKEAIKHEQCWSISSTNTTTEGRKVYYRCNMTKLRGRQCDNGMYILYDANSDNVVMYKATNPHTCATINTRPHLPMTTELKERVRTYFKHGIRKRKAIQTKLASDRVPLPSKNQLNNFIKQLRHEILRLVTINISELESLLQKYTAIPENENEAFIVNYFCDYEEEGNFRFLVSSKKLLRNIIAVTWQNFPLSPCGAIDMDPHCQLFGTLVSKNEHKDDYEFMFQSLKHVTAKLFNYDMQPQILIFDASKAIQNAFTNVFGMDLIILTCWLHMKKAVKKNP